MGARSHARSRSLIGTSATLAAGLALAGCGGAGHATKVTQPTSAAPSAKAPVAVPPVRLRILSPKAGAHTGTKLTVRVLLTGSSPGHPPSLRYVLDGAVTRRGSAQLTFQALRPGRHRLEVTLTQDRRIRAGSVFTVRLPPSVKAAPVAAPEPAPIVTTTSPPPSPSGGIPQGGGGDGDGDNSGGPSDGDGNV
jgi:hypothetical protein